MNNKFQNTFLGFLIICGITLCVVLLAIEGGKDKGNKKTNTTTEQSTAEIINAPAKEDIQECMAIITMLNTDAGMISLKAVDDYTEYTFNIGSGVFIYSATGTAMTASQLEMGEVVDVTFDALNNKLKVIRINEDTLENTAVRFIEFNESKRTAEFYGNVYEYDKELVIASGDRLIEASEITEVDVLRAYVKSGKLISLIVEKGHGYVTLSGVDLFMGGYVDVGGEVIKVIEKDMIILVGEGTYKVQVDKLMYSGSKTVEVKKDEVSVVDFSEIVKEMEYVGNVFFDINVDEAVLYVDGKETDYGTGVLTMPVGKYSIEVTADGFETYTDEIEIEADYQKISIVMKSEEAETESSTEKTTEAEKESEKESSTQKATEKSEETETERATKAPQGQTEETKAPVQGTGSAPLNNSTAEKETVVSSKNKVHVDGPVGSSVFFDGTYKGIAPVEFDLVTGSHTITVLEGTEIRTYTVYLVDGADDPRYDFSLKE